MTDPDVSIIVPAYNAGDYLSEAISSILDQQSSAVLEVLVVDDRSSDSRSVEVFDNVAQMDPRIRVLANERRQGPAGARNFGCSQARGRYLAFLDADDVWPPGSLQSRWDVVAADPEALWVIGEMSNWMPDGSLAERPNPLRGVGTP